MDDVDNLGQVRKVAIVVVALFLVHMGAMIGKGFIIARGKTKQSKKIYGYVASAVHYGFRLGFTYRITTVWNRSDKYSSIIRSGSDSASLCRNIHRYICCYGVCGRQV
jgi:hypothetical protein